MLSVNKQAFTALLYLLFVAILGLVLRFFPISDFTVDYRFVVHTHSHIALLGWVYIALTTMLYKIGIPQEKKKTYKYIFWSTQLTIIGMFFTFPFVGYTLYSIIFSTLFILCSYWFYSFFKKHNQLNKTTYSYKFINISLLFMIISSIGPWSLGMIMNTIGNTSHWYKNAIYFYLHFQYNGWFLFCLIGIFLFLIEKQQINISKSKLKKFYQLMVVSCILTLFLSFLWIKPATIIYLLAGLGAIFQIIGIAFFYKNLKPFFSKLKQFFGNFSYKLLQFIFALFLLKITLQLLNAVPFISEMISKFIDFVIGYLHLIFLGIITLTIFVFLNYLKLIKVSKRWIYIYLIGFICSEILIFYKGIFIWLQINYTENYFLYLVIVSSFLPISILGICFENIFKNSSTRLKSL